MTRKKRTYLRISTDLSGDKRTSSAHPREPKRVKNLKFSQKVCTYHYPLPSYHSESYLKLRSLGLRYLVVHIRRNALYRRRISIPCIYNRIYNISIIMIYFRTAELEGVYLFIFFFFLVKR